MDWNKVGAISSLGSFLVAAILFGVQVWPWPQLKGKGSIEVGSPKALVLFLLLGFLISSLTLYGVYHRPDFSSSFFTDDMETVSNQSFSGQTVELDGKRFVNCKFTQAELVFHGTKRFELQHNNFTEIGPIRIRTDNPAAFEFLQLFIKLEADNEWRTSFEFTLTNTKGEAIGKLSFLPEGYIQLVPKK